MNKLLVNISRGFLKMLSLFPLKFHYFMGGILSWLLGKVGKYRYSVVLVNLSRSFPQKKYGEIKRIARDFYRHLGDIIAETIWFSGSSHKRVHKSNIVSVANPELVSEYFNNSPSMTVLSTHCGNWELMGGFFAFPNGGHEYSFDEHNIKVVYKKLSNPVSDEVFRRNRVSPLKEVGTTCEVESSNILRYALSHRDQKLIYIYPADQAPYYHRGRHPIGMFLNQPTDAMQGSMGVACKMGHAVVYMKMKHVRRGHYEMSFIPLCDDASKIPADELLRKYYDCLEEEINETPHNWLWSHKRWK